MLNEFICTLTFSRDYPLFYNTLYGTYWTPFCGRDFDTLVELQIWCNEIDAQTYSFSTLAPTIKSGRFFISTQC